VVDHQRHSGLFTRVSFVIAIAIPYPLIVDSVGICFLDAGKKWAHDFEEGAVLLWAEAATQHRHLEGHVHHLHRVFLELAT
jgi:hypothetical protein